MPNIVLTYFPIAGRAEAVRLALTIGGIAFEDKRVGREDFMSMKEGGRLPFGQLPVIEVDGKMYGQSLAMLRYAGKLSGLYPTDPLEAMKVDEIMDSVNDYSALLGPSMREKDDAKKKEMREALAAGPIPTALANLSKQLEANGSTGYFVGSSLTIADVLASGITSQLKSGIIDHLDGEGILASFPLIQKTYDVVQAHAKVIEYYAPKK